MAVWAAKISLICQLTKGKNRSKFSELPNLKN